MSSIATRFRAILTDLRSAVWRQVGGQPAREAIFALLFGRLGRMAARFETLFAKWQSGTLPKPRQPRAEQSRPVHPRPTLPTIPQGRGWLLSPPEHFRMAAALASSRLQQLLADPDAAAFLQAAPQVGRMLRPLCRMLAADLPTPLRLPPRPRPATPPPTPKPARASAAPWRQPIYPIGFRPLPFIKSA